ncbi:MAG: Succinate-semialdehyde dehydrogenase [Parcubacteria group bacterium Gr01-1014_3]|nr:MAG: Succinate-semialdehyde dehydrogenase [Parcubacteria group bacterium Gr01-1014_3]
MLRSINPSNYKVVGSVKVSTPKEISDKVRQARLYQKYWSEMGAAMRVHMVRKAMAEFEKRKDEVIKLESMEMGKPITAAASDFNDAMAFANWYLDNAEKCLAAETTFEDEKEIHRVYREPLGVAAVIIPWNYPFLMFVWTVIPNLLAGNCVVLKHSEECPLIGKLIEEVMHKYVHVSAFSEVYGGGEVGMLLVRNDIGLISFTGSTATGKKLYETAGRKFIRAVMEMGGSAPGIVFEDANIDEAVKSICTYRLTNAGQYCDGLKRLMVHQDRFEEVVSKLSNAFATLWVGPADLESTELGPLVAKRQLDLLAAQVADAKRLEARVITGGKSLESELGGAFFQPTLLTGVTPAMRVWREEVFGPVLPVVRFRTEDEAISIANDTVYGLGGYVYTADMNRAERVARALKTGMVSINGTNYTTPFNPFGGWKNSGMGREHGKYGFHELTQTKVVARNK